MKQKNNNNNNNKLRIQPKTTVLKLNSREYAICVLYSLMGIIAL